MANQRWPPAAGESRDSRERLTRPTPAPPGSGTGPGPRCPAGAEPSRPPRSARGCGEAPPGEPGPAAAARRGAGGPGGGRSPLLCPIPARGCPVRASGGSRLSPEVSAAGPESPHLLRLPPSPLRRSREGTASPWRGPRCHLSNGKSQRGPPPRGRG